MIYIDDSKINIVKAKKEHQKIVSNYLRKKKSNDVLQKQIIDFVKKYINILTIGNPLLLEKLNNEFYDSINNHSYQGYSNYLEASRTHNSKRNGNQKRVFKKYQKLNEEVKKIIKYDDWFIVSKAKIKPDYNLAQNLNIKTCTYCNRIYTNTMKKANDRRLMRPQFDHWFPKSKFPLLALSFYNLIPSCAVCNSSAKSDTIFSLNTHLHPYIDKDITSRFSFSYDHFKGQNKFKVKAKFNNYGDRKAYKTITDLNLKSMYNAHISELKDLIQTKKAYSESYLKNMKRAYPKAKLTDQEIYRLAFGTELNENDFSDRPFSKFNKDILLELGII